MKKRVAATINFIAIMVIAAAMTYITGMLLLTWW